MTKTKTFAGPAMLLVSCGLCALGGFALGARMQYKHTVSLQQDLLARDLLVARICARSGCDHVMKWVTADAPLQLKFYAAYREPLTNGAIRGLYEAAMSTWLLRNIVAPRHSPDEFRREMQDCNCGLEPAASLDESAGQGAPDGQR